MIAPGPVRRNYKLRVWRQKNGQAQGGFAEYEIQIEGPDGLLPNLDLVNILVRIGNSHGIKFIVGSRDLGLFKWMDRIRSAYWKKIVHLFLMAARQALGYPRFGHGPFLKYN